MAQPQNKRFDRQFEKPNIPGKVILPDGKPVKITYSVTIIDLAKALVDGHDVTVTLDGKNPKVVTSVGGKVGGEIEISEGEHTLEMEMLDTNGDRVFPNVSKKIVGEKPQQAKEKHLIHFDVHVQRRPNGYLVSADMLNEHGDPILDHADVKLRIDHPDVPKGYKLTISRGSGQKLVAFGNKPMTPLTISGLGRRYDHFIGIM
jgi:hypothetical protein